MYGCPHHFSCARHGTIFRGAHETTARTAGTRRAVPLDQVGRLSSPSIPLADGCITKKQRKKDMKKFVSLLCICIFTILIPHIAVSDVLPCGQNDIPLDGTQDIQVIGESYVYEGPSEESRKVINQKASQNIGTIIFHSIDVSTTVKSICSNDEWTYIKISEPSWLTHVEGWVKSNVLRPIIRDEKNNRIYTEEDFYWDNISKKYNNDMVDAMNFLNASGICKGMQPYSLSYSRTRSTTNLDVFYITCGEGGQAKNIFFNQDDIKEWSIEYRKGK